MYINSNFTDYYDFCTKYGQDPKIVYNRKTSTVPTIDKKKLGWDMLPPRYITDKGTPKQSYFPQYDRDLVGKPIPLDQEEQKKKEVLNVEII